MRRMTVIALLAAFAAAACGKAAGPGPAPTTTGTDACAKQNLQLVNAGALTVGTSNPAYPPYFTGAHTDDSPWKSNDPYTGKGFESAVAYAVARQLGFPHDEVRWVESPFNQSYAPGPKNWDLNIQQISYSKKRAEAVDFSDSYYNESEVLVAKKGTPIANAKSISDLKPYKLAAPLGTTSYEIITDVIKPTKEPGGYQSLADTVAAFNAGAVDGIIVDLGGGGLLAVGGRIPVGYWRDPDKTAQTFRVIDGRRYALAGDYAQVDADGTIRLLGRGSACINTGGEKVYPEEVELTLGKHPSVFDCVAVGVPDDRFGEIVVALVQVTEGHYLDEAELDAWCRSKLAGFKKPRRFLLVDSLERNAAGKANYQVLRQLAGNKLGQ